MQKTSRSRADPNAKDKEGETPLHIEIQHIDPPKPPVITDLVAHGADLYIQSKEDKTPIDFVRLYDQEQQDTINKAINKALEGVKDAIANGKLKKVKQYINTHTITTSIESKKPPLHYAVEQGQYDIAEYLTNFAVQNNMQDVVINKKIRTLGTPYISPQKQIIVTLHNFLLPMELISILKSQTGTRLCILLPKWATKKLHEF